MNGTGGDDSTRTPQQVLEALHKAASRLKTRLPQVTPEIEALTHKLNLYARVLERMKRARQGLYGLKQWTGAAAAEVKILAEEIAELPLLDLRRGRLMEDYRKLSRARPFWHKMAATDFIQSAQLADNNPLDPDPRRDLAIAQTTVFAWVKSAFEASHIRVGSSPASIACCATAELVKLIPGYGTTAAAVSSEVRRQDKRQREAQTEKVSKKPPI